MFVATDVSATEVWYGAFRINQFKFFYTSPGAHTMESRGGLKPGEGCGQGDRCDAAQIPLPPIAEGFRQLQAAGDQRGA